jgi:Ca2+-binding RTX toxin-like protein
MGLDDVLSLAVNLNVSITLEASTAFVLEDGVANLAYVFTRTGFIDSPLTVNYSVAGTARLVATSSDPVDYGFAGSSSTATNRSVTFAAGSSTATVIVDPRPDTRIEADETVALTLEAGMGYSIGTTEAVVGTIRNDDFPRVTLALTPASVTEDGASNLIYTFTRTGPTTQALSVNYVVGGSAILGDDYTGIATDGTAKTIAFAEGSSTVTVTVDPTPDSMIEPNETVALTLASGADYAIGTSKAVVGTISNDDLPLISLALSNADVSEDGDPNLVYTFTRTGPTTQALSVMYVVGGSASLGTDYTGIATSGSTKTVVFAKGASTAIVTVNPRADATIEPDETVSLTLATGSAYSIATTSAVTGTIRNDDLPRITLAVSPAAAKEDSTSTLIYTFTRTGPTTEALSVMYNVGGTASAGDDYTGIPMPGANQSIVFFPGFATAKLIIDPTADTTIEPDETVSLTLTAGSGYTIGTSPAVIGTLKNDDSRAMLYDATLSSLPNQQGWLAFGTGLTGSQSPSSNGTTLTSGFVMADAAGYSNHVSTTPTLVNRTFPNLDRALGFGLDFRLRLLRESHQTTNRAGFSVILLDQGASPRGIELGFWTNSIFSQSGGSTPFQTIAERVDGIDTTIATSYSLRVLDQSYYLLAGNRLLLSGSVQDYSQWQKDALLPYNPYTTPNFLFLGDNSRDAKGSVELGTTTLTLPLTGSAASETLTGTAGADQLNGLDGADQLNGGGGEDWLVGGAGTDTLNGGAGDDLLIGGSGPDAFFFSSGARFNSSQLGVDTIADFNLAEDRLRLARATFPNLPAGTSLSATAFAVVGSDGEAASSTALIVYNSRTGGLFYNANGSATGFASTIAGGGAFAQLRDGVSALPLALLTSDAFALV